MSFKYLNKLGIQDDCVWFNRNLYIDGVPNKTKRSLKRIKQWEKERKKYGFDSRETWALDTSAAQWLYCHLKMFMKVNCVDLTYNRFKIPVLIPKKTDELEFMNSNSLGSKYAYSYMKEKEIDVTLEEAIQWCIDYLKDYLTYDDKEYDTKDDNWLVESHKDETIAIEKAKCAFKIFSVIFSAMWW